MADIRIDWTACIASGGPELVERISAARSEYSGMCAEYFDHIMSKQGKHSAFTESACGFILLDSLLKKNGIDRRSLAIAIAPNGRPCVINRSDVDFSISHSEGAAMCCLAIGGDASVGADIQHVRRYSDERLEELSRTFMEQREINSLLKGGSAEKTDMFYRAWTRRESCYKRCGQDRAPFPGTFTAGVISSCGERYYYSINIPENDD